MITINEKQNCAVIMNTSAYQVVGQNAVITQIPALHVAVKKDKVVFPDCADEKLTTLNSDVLNKHNTVVIRTGIEHNSTSSLLPAHDASVTEIKHTHYVVYPFSDLSYVSAGNNLCEALDCAAYIGTYALVTNHEILSAEALGRYVIPTTARVTQATTITNDDTIYGASRLAFSAINIDSANVTATTYKESSSKIKIQFDTNKVFPSSLGVSMIFSASQMPDKFMYIGIKGGPGGTFNRAMGKLIPVSDITCLDASKHIYMYNDTIVDNLQFRTQALGNTDFYKKTENNEIITSALYLAEVCVTDNLTYNITTQDYITELSDTEVFNINNIPLSGFNFMSIIEWARFDTPDTTKLLTLSPSSVDILPNYNPYAAVRFNDNNNKYVMHSNMYHNSHGDTWKLSTQIGYDGFRLDTGTATAVAIKNWGDTSKIFDMQATLSYNNFTQLPSSWGNWENLNNAIAMFRGADLSATSLPDSWHGLSAVEDAANMFSISTVTHIPNSWEGLDSLKDASCMFLQSTVQNLPTDLFEKCHNVNNISAMFLQCYKLTATSADVKKFITDAEDAGLTTAQYYHCFCQCSALQNYNTLKTEYPIWFED